MTTQTTPLATATPKVGDTIAVRNMDGRLTRKPVIVTKHEALHLTGAMADFSSDVYHCENDTHRMWITLKTASGRIALVESQSKTSGGLRTHSHFSSTLSTVEAA